jgi:hypothetical protein
MLPPMVATAHGDTGQSAGYVPAFELEDPLYRVLVLTKQLGHVAIACIRQRVAHTLDARCHRVIDAARPTLRLILKRSPEWWPSELTHLGCPTLVNLPEQSRRRTALGVLGRREMALQL